MGKLRDRASTCPHYAVAPQAGAAEAGCCGTGINSTSQLRADFVFSTNSVGSPAPCVHYTVPDMYYNGFYERLVTVYHRVYERMRVVV